MSNILNPRAEAFQTLVDLWRKVRSGAYVYVKRGAVNWATFVFEKYPRAVTIVQDECSLLKSAGNREAAVTFEIMAKIPPKPANDPDRDIIEINDELQDEMILDAEKVLQHFQLKKSSVDSDFSVAYKVITENTVITEVHDPVIAVQGILIPFDIGF